MPYKGVRLLFYMSATGNFNFKLMKRYIICLIATIICWGASARQVFSLNEECDIKRAEEARQRAEEKLRQKQSIHEYYQTQAALNRAMNRLKVSQKHFR